MSYPKPQKQSFTVNFLKGLDLKTDPNQVQASNYLSLVNSVFDKVGRLTKRNGFPNLSVQPSEQTSFLTTHQGGLLASGQDLFAYSPEQSRWIQKNSVYPMSLSVQSSARSQFNQDSADTAAAPNGVVCVTWVETVYTSFPSTYHSNLYYTLVDSNTGEVLTPPTTLFHGTNTPILARVFSLGTDFVLVFCEGPAAPLQYQAIHSATGLTGAAANLSLSFNYSTNSVPFDAYSYGGFLYIAWLDATAGINVASLQAGTYALSSVVQPDTTFPAQDASLSVTVDSAIPLSPIIWVSYAPRTAGVGYAFAVDSSLVTVLAPTTFIASDPYANLTSIAHAGLLTAFGEVINAYSYDAAIPTHFIRSFSVTQAGSTAGGNTLARSVGLASKAFFVGTRSYILTAYQSPFQPTYFLLDVTATVANQSVQNHPSVIAKLAYLNGGGYNFRGLPNVLVNGSRARTVYLFKDLLEAVNKGTNLPSGTPPGGIYSQTGVNSALFDFTLNDQVSVETGKDLHFGGGFLWMYDGGMPVEHNFFLGPDSLVPTVTTLSGTSNIASGDYFYQAIYQWTDNQGNQFYSPPSVTIGPIHITSNSQIAVDIPTLRLTYKASFLTPTSNPVSSVNIQLYRYSVAQPVYYQVTSVIVPLQNDMTVDSVHYVDNVPDSAILGNQIIYTNGGVLEDTNAPASKILSLFDDRLWLVDAEEPNLLWFSKQVLEATPVEMSDLLTFFVAPTIGAEGPTGDITALSPMDDKLIVFKQNAIYYINGQGPDNTGANNQYSQPIFITASVGCDTPNSIVMIPEGLLFKSNKGIWLLGRGLNTVYLGAPVDALNQYAITTAQAIPNTNQVRFSLSNGETLLYDYFVNQWGTFSVPAVSSTIYQGLQTLVDGSGNISQESPGAYVDGTNTPVLMSLQTAWIKLSQLRGYQRAYWFYILGEYLSPHELQIGVSYNYDTGSPFQTSLFTPGTSPLEQFRCFFTRQRCFAFQLTLTEISNPANVQAGPGLTLSGLDLTAGFKKGYAPIPQVLQIG